MSKEEWCVYCGGVATSDLLPTRRLFFVRSQGAPEHEAARILEKFPAINWVSLGRSTVWNEVRYYRDMDKTVHRIDLEAEPRQWVGALFYDGCYEPATFVVAPNRTGAQKRVSELFAKGALLQKAAVFQAARLSAGWMSGTYTDVWKRGDDGGVSYRDQVEESRQREIKELQVKLAGLQGQGGSQELLD